MIKVQHLPLAVATALLTLGGFFLLHRADEQARDTIRKHHLADLEQALFFARELQGTFPPYEEASWCGLLNDPKNSAVQGQIKEVLRKQNNTYANLEKPFPRDPLPRNDYFYWKRSPAVFELYAVLEQDDTNERNSLACANSPAYRTGRPALYFDYGTNSRWREDFINLTS